MEEDTLKELRRELESEREKVKRLEELLKREESEVSKKEGLLNELYRRIIVEGISSREEVAKAIGREQYEALAYHLSKENERRVEAEKKAEGEGEKLRLAEKKLVEDEESIQKDSQRLMELEEELASERKKRIEFEKQLLKKYAKHAETGGKERDDVDLSDLESVVRQARPKVTDVTVGDLAKLMLRIRRIKSVDASIMLNTGKENVLRLASPLVSRKYIKIENPGSPDPTLRALKKLLDLKGRRK